MRVLVASLILIVAALYTGCASPLEKQTSRELRDQVLATIRRDVENAQAGLSPTPEFNLPFYLDESPEILQQLDEDTGPASVSDSAANPGQTLGLSEERVVRISLQQVIQRVVENSLDLRLARLQPAISEADLISAEAAFDALFFAEGSFTKTDRPQPVRVVTSDPDGPGPLPPSSVPVGVDTSVSDTLTLRTGIRKLLDTGGQVELSTGADWNKNKTPGIEFRPDPSWTTNITLGIQQPLLRNFGTEVNRASIYIARNAHSRAVLDQHETVTEAVANAEELYWSLLFLERQQSIYYTDLKRAEEDRDIIRNRETTDAVRGQVAQAESFVQGALENIVTNTKEIHSTSDQLKRLMSDPELPLSDDTVLVPIDEPVVVPVDINFLESLVTALKSRPDARRALLDIDDASIRQKVARNLKLPKLDLGLQTSFQGLNDQDGGVGNSYDNLTRGDFIEYLVSLSFEQPIGNRAAIALEQRETHRKQASVISYHRTGQQIQLEVKDALRELDAAYRLIEIRRNRRRADADYLRSLTLRMKEADGFTPGQVDQRLRAGNGLRDSERRENAAILQYNIALMRAKQAQGTLLEHNNINFLWPEGMFSDR